MACILPIRITAWCFSLVAMVSVAAANTVLPPGQPLQREIVEGMISQALVGQGLVGQLTVRVDRPQLPLPNRAARPISLSVASLRHDPSTGRYEAHIVAKLEDGETSSIAVSGVAEELVEVPVLKRSIAPGEIIVADDLEWRSLPEPQLQPDTVLDLQAVVGQEAQRPLQARRALRGRDLGTPILVRRGEPVGIVYLAGRLEITTAGIALEAGRRNDPVQVQNTASGEVRRGIVEGPRRIRITGGGFLP
jgi:flagella basal body P-ring formation protein FlgA